MKIIHLFYFSFLFISYTAKAQYTNEDYKITYKLKLYGVFSPGEAKIAKNNLIGIFDSRDFKYSQTDSIITIRSALVMTKQKLSGRLNEYGYNVLLVSINHDEYEINSNK